MKQELTPWFCGSCKPQINGVYERGLDMWKGPVYAHWNGRYWSSGKKTISEAAKNQKMSGFQGKTEWRGLANKP